MKKYPRRLLLCALGLAIALSIYWINQNSEEIDRKTATPRYVLGPKNPQIRKFEWRQPLLHPTYPPKLVQDEREFVLK